MEKRVLVGNIFLGLFLMSIVSLYPLKASAFTVDYAKKPEELVATVQMANSSVDIKVLNIKDEFYLFLPAGAGDFQFTNVKSEDNLELFGEELSFYNASEDTLYEVSLHICRSEKIGSVFIDLNDNTREYLDSVRKMKLPGLAAIYDSEGCIDVGSNLQFVRTRGNSTYNTPNNDKKAYEIKFEKRESVFGMKKAKKWVLLANSFDRSLIKNALVYDFTKDYTSLPSEEGYFVDVYINGEYLGNYYLCEKVEVDKNRLAITEQDNLSGKVTDITGGYLVELIDYEDHVEEGVVYFETDSGYLYEIKSPEEPTMEQQEYIRGIFNELESAVKAEDGVSPLTGRHYSEIIDIDSYVSRYLVETVFMNPDMDYNSQYYYKDSDSMDGKLYAGPVWDYDLAMVADESPLNIRHYYLSEFLLEKEDVKNILKDCYKNVFEAFVTEDLEDRLSEYKNLIGTSYKLNQLRWGWNTEAYSYGYASLGANTDYLLDKLRQRTSFIGETINGATDSCVLSFHGFNGNTESVCIKKGDTYSLHYPRYVDYISLIGGWENEATKEKLSPSTVINEDTDFYPVKIGMDYLLTHSYDDLINGEIDISGLDPVDVEKIAYVIERMQENEQ